MEGEGGKRLVEQCSKLSTWREAAFVLSFGKKAFTALSLDDILATRGRTRGLHGTPLSDYLAGPFVDCAVGDTDLRYIRGEHRLIWRAMNGETVAVKFVVRHRFRLKVAAPGSTPSTAAVDREINPDEIHKFRMSASYEDILALKPGRTQAPSAARKALSKIYHPDQWEDFNQPTRDAMKSRMQEVNAAYDDLKRRR
jgi:hypothetical protein